MAWPSCHNFGRVDCWKVYVRGLVDLWQVKNMGRVVRSQVIVERAVFISSRPDSHSDLPRQNTGFFGDFKCGALLFMVIHVIYKYKNR